ncbi:hypothetical protein [Paraburkholderia domus]|uniref:Uncharacterized protein n=1 Tax=Paraburkholderia domus TaxID=2793075 RepID=A0A9N8N6J6_9BURK|nr:hypothetical protein [Paraburkholderia domus]MBK5162757.1 hypothetical protein [Burkholderia sp. R-70211]CAE6958581.1 hypothetical protein R70211_06766 [Paraburkholderia domus]
MSGGGGSTSITNWPMMTDPLQSGVYGAVNQVWYNQQANANQWAAQAKANDDANRAQHQKDIEAWSEQQDDWRIAWAVAQAAYAAAQTLLANNALNAAKDAADKQYDIANRQQNIAEEEYARYSAHFAPCENVTVDTECARPEYTEPIEDEANRAATDIRVSYALARQMAQRRRDRYCVGSMIAFDRQTAIEEARSVAEAKERTRRYLEERQEQRRDKYFNRKLQLFNIGRNIKADAVSELRMAAEGIGRGTDIELAARNQYYGAILSSIGGLIGAFLPNSTVPQTSRSAAAIGGVSSFGSTTSFGGAPMMGPGGLGYGFGAYSSGNMQIDNNTLAPASTSATFA